MANYQTQVAHVQMLKQSLKQVFKVQDEKPFEDLTRALDDPPGAQR